MDSTKKWWAKNIYVDVDTGELISGSYAKKRYLIIRKTKKIYEQGSYNICEWTNECQRSKQLRLL